MHPDGARLDDGGIVKPSNFQLKIWSFWREFWDSWVPTVTRGEPFAIVHNGDCIDGSHHGSTHQWSHNLEDQIRHAELVLKPIAERAKLGYYHVRGTQAHVGESGIYEEQLALRLGAVANTEGQFAHWNL